MSQPRLRPSFAFTIFGALWPFYALYWAWATPEAPRVVADTVGVVALFFYFALRWDVVPYRLREVSLIAALAAGWRAGGVAGAAVVVLAALGVEWVLRRPAVAGPLFAWVAPDGRLDARLRLAAGDARSARGISKLPPDEGAGLEIDLPLRAGTSMAVHGGAWAMLNKRHASPAQRYAVDLTRLNGVGARARGVYPRTLDAYAIYGDEVVSPCAGRVVAASDEWPDLEPGNADRLHPAGNHIILALPGERVHLLLAHLMAGSVRVKVGDAVVSGQALGRVGNSGNTTEPHLHIHAESGGRGVPLRLAGKWPARNVRWSGAGR